MLVARAPMRISFAGGGHERLQEWQLPTRKHREHNQLLSVKFTCNRKSEGKKQCVF
jgi:hypothetical protein